MVRGGRHSRKIGGRSTCTLVLFMLFMLSVVFLVLLALGIVSLPLNDNAQDGLSNEAGSSSSTEEIVDMVNLQRWNHGVDGPKQWMEILSWEPRAFLYHNFLSRSECEYLINLAQPHMKKSTVVDSQTGRSMDSRVRTSSGTFLKRGQDKFIKDIENRIAEVSFVPIEHGEGIQVLHYAVGQKYEAHHDYFHDNVHILNGGQRMATMLMYLSDVEKGGETVFPKAQVNSSSVPWWDELSDCAKAGISVRPRMGDALLFWSMHPDASLDSSSLHGGCPVIQGDKWSATKWMRVKPYTV
ncbi:unnamed protein product [Victoria cruziana]